MAATAICHCQRCGTAILHSTECQKRSFVQLQVDENSARAAALHSDLELQNLIEFPKLKALNQKNYHAVAKYKQKPAELST